MRLAAQNRREQLLDVAMRLFAAQGFDGTTTREIAEAADVNEAIIFRHFANKEDLYWAVVSDRISKAGRQEKIKEQLASGDGDAQVLSAVAETLLSRQAEDEALTRLLLFSALKNSQLADRFFRTYVADCYELVSEYIRKGIQQGRFREVDPLIAARGFLGMISNHCLVQEIFGGDRHQQFEPRVVARQLADMWLNGIVAQPETLTTRTVLKEIKLRSEDVGGKRAPVGPKDK